MRNRNRHKPPIRSRGYLPHDKRFEQTFFVTFRLFGSLPAQLYRRWVRELSDRPRREQNLQLFHRVEQYLDQGLHIQHLSEPRVAATVQDALKHFNNERYVLHAWVIMLNHLHVQLTLLRRFLLENTIRSWKSFPGREANRLLGLSGPFWQPGYYDRTIRDERHFKQSVWYIHQNPVRAGLCEAPEEYRWSSASTYRSFSASARGED